MSVDAKLFVTCGKEDMFKTIAVVTETLNVYSRAKLDEYLLPLGMNRFQYEASSHQEKYTNGCHFTGYQPDCISFIFGSGDTMKRSLTMCLGCDSDNSDIYVGEKISFSIGCWGKSDEIMLELGEALKCLGDVYYDFNDCDEHGFVML